MFHTGPWSYSITNRASKLTHPCLQGEGADGRGEILSQIHFLLIGVWTLGGPLLMDPDDLLDTLTSSVHHWEDGLTSNPPASPPGWVGIGGRPPGPTLWSFMHHANLLSSCCRCCCCLLFYPCYWVERRCFNPGLMAGVSRWALICNTHPFGVGGVRPFLIGTQRVRLDYYYACKYTCSLFCGTILSQHVFGTLFFYFRLCCLEFFLIILMLLSMCY